MTKLNKQTDRALRALDLWGMVETERHLTGDAAAVPKMPAWADGSPPPRVTPGRTPSGILDVWIDVETAIAEAKSELIRPIVRWVHVDATRYTPDRATYQLADGSVAEHSFSDDPPVGFVDVRYSYCRKQRPWSELPESLCLRLKSAGRLMRPEDLPRMLYWRFVSALSRGQL